MENKRWRNILFYADPDDPRLYIHNDPRHKWFGVTLNFSHPRAWRTFGIIIGACLWPWLVFEVLRALETGKEVMIVSAIAASVWSCIAAPVVTVHCFRAAERELRQYGEKRNIKGITLSTVNRQL